MASLNDILSTVQNGVTAASGFTKQLQGSVNNISSQLTILSSQISIHGSSSQFGTVKVDGITVTASSGVLSATTASAATKAQQQTGTSNTVFVTPLHQQDHDSAIKAWAMFTGSTSNGTQTINASYNITSVTRIGTGQYNIVLTTAFASSAYACFGSNNGGTTDGFVEFTSQAAGSIQADFISKAAAVFDPINGAYVMFAGRQ